MNIGSVERHVENGKIRDMEGYLDGKKFDHSAWVEITARGATPINIDFSIDNGSGFFLEGEVSRTTFKWNDYPNGQHHHFRNKVMFTAGTITAALVMISTPRGEEVNTIADVTDFSVMYFKVPEPGNYEDLRTIQNVHYETYHGNDKWRKLVDRWWRTGKMV